MTVQVANQHAIDGAADRIDHLGRGKSFPVSASIIEMLGGEDAYVRAVAEAKNWKPHARLLSATYYYPLMSKTNAAIPMSKGRLLLTAFTQCLDFFQQIMNEK